MSGLASWYGKPIASLCIIGAIAAASLFLLANAEFGPREDASLAAIAVTIRQYGVDSREMERSIAIPLEDALSALEGSREVFSTSEYGKVRVLVRFGSVDPESAYEAVRDAAQRIYERLPSSAQRPEISSSSEGRGPVWIAAVSSKTLDEQALGGILEKTVKPALEKLPGAGDVEISGSAMPEIIVGVREEALASCGLGLEAVIGALASNDRISTAGFVQDGSRRAAIILDGRFAEASALAELPIPAAEGASIRLGTIATIAMRNRVPESLARMDGKQVAVVAVNAGGQANLSLLSRALASEVKKLSEAGLVFTVLSDTGATVEKSFMSTLLAAAQGAVAVALASLLLLRSDGRTDARSRASLRRTRFVCVLVVPTVLLVSAGILAALGFGMDRNILAGLSTGIGAAVDAAILSAERLTQLGGKFSPDAKDDAAKAMRALFPSLVAGAATTVVALIPLASLDALCAGVGRTAIAIAATSIVAVVAALLFLPPLIVFPLGEGFPVAREALVNGVNKKSSRVAGIAASVRRFAGRLLRRTLGRNAWLCARKPLIPISAMLAFSLCGAAAFALLPMDPSPPSEGDSVYAHIELEPGTSVPSVDERLAAWSEAIMKLTGVKNVQTTARRGTGSATVTFDAKATTRQTLSEQVRASEIPGGFVWIPEPNARERTWDLTISGDSDELCRQFAGEAATACMSIPFVLQTVLNFKEGPEDIVMRPDRDKLASLGLPFSAVADALRRSIHGPVAYKRVNLDGERDARVTVLRDGLPVSGDPARTVILTKEGSIRTADVLVFSRERDTARVNRQDRKRVASITIRARVMDPCKAKAAVLASVSSITLPAGYAYSFDKPAIEGAAKLQGTLLSFLLAALFIYMSVAAINESLGVPFAVLSVLLPSIALPAILMAAAGMSFDPPAACAFVAVAGMAVNASVLTVDGRRVRASGARAGIGDLYSMTRSRFGSLLATCGTTVAGALPFLFLADEGSAMVRSLAFVTVTGMSAAFIASLVLVPAMAALFPRLFPPLKSASNINSVINLTHGGTWIPATSNHKGNLT